MPRGNNQKLKLLYLARIFSEETDESHGLTVAQLADRLAQYGISADRKTLYTDFEELRRFGLDIVSVQTGKTWYYHLASRPFELAELKLLVDSVQSSKFITETKSRQLIHRLESLVSKYDAIQLNRQVLISGRVKTMNESIYYNVDKIHDAIGRNRQIRFQYFQWNLDKKPAFRRGGSFYTVSPWHLRWHDENYYLIAYDAADNILKHYRVDKMKEISSLDAAREGQTLMKSFDAAVYTKRLFGMYGGESIRVTMEGEAAIIGVLIDRFGMDLPVIKLDDGHFKTFVEVAVSPQFYGWIASLGGKLVITAPESVRKGMRELLQSLSAQY